MGKSASGKDTFYRELMRTESLELRKLILYTTRPMRDGEENGREYFFVAGEQLEAFRKQGRIIEEREYQTIYGPWFYFTADDGQIHWEGNDYLGIGTLESFCALKAYYGEDKICPVYIEVEDGERLMRALQREKEQVHPHYAEMCRRFLADEEDFSEDKLRNAGIHVRFENSDMEKCLEKIKGYIQQYRSQR